MGFLQGVRSWFRDMGDAQRLLAIPREQRRIVVYSEDRYTWNQMQGYIERVAADHDVHYVTSDPDDPLFADHPKRMQMFYVKRIASMNAAVDREILQHR